MPHGCCPSKHPGHSAGSTLRWSLLGEKKKKRLKKQLVHMAVARERWAVRCHIQEHGSLSGAALGQHRGTESTGVCPVLMASCPAELVTAMTQQCGGRDNGDSRYTYCLWWAVHSAKSFRSISFHPPKNSVSLVYTVCSFYRGENWGLERFKQLPQHHTACKWWSLDWQIGTVSWELD